MEQLTFLSEARPANPSASPGFAKALLTIEETSPLNLYGLLKGLAPDGWFGKMCLACCRSTEDGRLAASSEGWRNAGMGSPTGFLTLNISECHSAAAVCSLSDILEIGDLPRQFYLSAKACAGILRRAEKRGKELPEQLRRALQGVAELGSSPKH